MYEIKVVTNEVQKYEIYSLRYKVYIEEMQRKSHYANHKKKILKDFIDDENCTIFGAYKFEKLIGTMRSSYPRNSNLGEYETFYNFIKLTPEKYYISSITTKLMILPEFRRGTLAVRIGKVAYQKGLIDGINYDYIDCNDHLVTFFYRLGYQYVKKAAHPEYGIVNIMRLNLLDLNYLRKVNSPLVKYYHEVISSQNK